MYTINILHHHCTDYTINVHSQYTGYAIYIHNLYTDYAIYTIIILTDILYTHNMTLITVFLLVYAASVCWHSTGR